MLWRRFLRSYIGYNEIYFILSNFKCNPQCELTLLFLTGEIVIENSRRRHQTTNRMKGLVHLFAAISLVEIDARVVTEDKNIATALATNSHAVVILSRREKKSRLPLVEKCTQEVHRRQ